MVTVSTRRGLTTQTSAAVPPCCMPIALGSGAWPMRAKPPCITCQPRGVRARNTRRLIGRGSRRPSTKAGVVESITDSWPTRLGPSASSQASKLPAAPGRKRLPRIVASSGSKGRRVESAGPIIIRSRWARTWARSAGWPHHQVAMFGRISGSPRSARAMRGMKASSARVSSTPEPRALTRVTEPWRAAPTRPGVPSREVASSSSGSAKAASRRRQSTVTGRRPATVRTMTRPFSTVRSSPSSRVKPR